MHAILKDNSKCRYYVRLDLIRVAKAMLLTLTFIWMVNVIVLVTSPTVSTKSTPCFTDGDCPSSLEKCVYGSWKGLGNCHRKARESGSATRRMVRSDTRSRFRNRRLVRRKRNPSSIWNDSYLSQKRWDVWLQDQQRNTAPVDQLTKTDHRQQTTNERFSEIAADLLTFGRSYVTIEGINYTISAFPAQDGGSDWLIAITKDEYNPNDSRETDYFYRDRHKPNHGQLLDTRGESFTDDELKTTSILLENSFGSSGMGDAAVDISVRYPIPALPRRRYRRGSDIHLRLRRQLPVRVMELNSADPLINRFKHVEPIIPSAEVFFGKNVGKRSVYAEKEMQRIRRELDEIEEDVAPLPKVLKNPDESPIIIEDMFNGNDRTSALRKRSNFKAENIDKTVTNRVTRHKRHHKAKDMGRSLTKTDMARLLSRSSKRSKRKIPQAMPQSAPKRKDRSKKLRKTSRHRVKKQTSKRKSAKRRHTSRKRKSRTALSKFPKDAKRSNAGQVAGPITPGTTEAPDPFATLRNTKQPHIDYYDVSKRNLFKDEDDSDPDSSFDDDDPESSLDDEESEPESVEEIEMRRKRQTLADDPESSLDDDESEPESVEEVATRRKRQTLAEEMEDEDEQDIPSWRDTVELLQRANTFAVPAHDSSGHIILVRRVRDLGALDLGESLVKLKETMAKIFGRCSPARRRKRSRHSSPPEVVTDELSNGETWEIQGEGREFVDQAKIDVHMDDDKPYNVTTVLKPMGKRSSNLDVKNMNSETTGGFREMRDILNQNAKLDKLTHLKAFQNNRNVAGARSDGRIARGHVRSGHAKRDDEEEIPLNKDVHMEAQEGAPVEIDLTVDEEPGGAQPVAEVKSNGLTMSPEKRNQYQPSGLAGRRFAAKTGQYPTHLISRNPLHSPHFSPMNSGKQAGDVMHLVRRGHHEKCVGCSSKQVVQSKAFSGMNSRKAVREPYIITRKYNDSKVRQARAESDSGRSREAEDADKTSLLYLAGGDPLPSSWRTSMTNSKRDVDVEIDVEEELVNTTGSTTKEDTTTTTTTTTEKAPSTVKITIKEKEKEKDEDVFSEEVSTTNNGKSTSLEAEASITTERKSKPRGAASFVLGGRAFSETLPTRTKILSLSPPRQSSVMTVMSEDRSPMIEETITSASDPDWGISGSSDRLMSLISGIEKALRVPLGGGSDASLDQVTLVDDSSDTVQTQFISSQPEITEQKTSYLYSVDPQPPLVVETTTRDKKPDVVKMDVTTGTGAIETDVSQVNENIYLKGFELPRKPSKPLFVDKAAKNMIWVDPTYKTVVSSSVPKYKYPLGYARLYNGPIVRTGPAVDQWTQITNYQNSDTIEDISLGGDKQVTFDKFSEQPSSSVKMTEFLQPAPRVFGVQKNIMLTGQLVADPPPPPETETDIKVVSSVSSGDAPPGKGNDKYSPTVTVQMDGENGKSSSSGNSDSPSNIRIFHNGRDSDGKIMAAIGMQSNVKKKKEIQDIVGASESESSSIFSSNDFTQKKVNSDLQDIASLQLRGNKRSVQHAYQVPGVAGKQALKRKVSKGTPVAAKRADANAPIVHTYSKDPGVQGATMEMLNDLSARLTAQNAQKRKTAPQSRRNAACAHGGANCRQTKHVKRDLSVAEIDSKMFALHEVPQPVNTEMRKIRKRDVSRSIFEQPKIFIVSPNTIMEAPGTKYKFLDPLERVHTLGDGNKTTHLKVYTLSNVDADAKDKGQDDGLSNTDESNDDDKHVEYDSASNLPMSHEKALQETESQERYKITDSIEGFSVDAPSFDKKVTSGGQISEDLMVPVPVNIDRLELPKVEDKVSITADIEPHRHRPGLKVSATEVEESGNFNQEQKTKTIEYVDSADNIPETRADVGEVVEVFKRNSAANTRQKRRSPNAGTGIRKSREEKIEALRTELKNLNNIGSRLGLNFFDKNSIDRIVREVSSEGESDVTSEENALSSRSEKSLKHKHKRRISHAGPIAEKGSRIRAGKKRRAKQRAIKKHRSLNTARNSPITSASSSLLAKRSSDTAYSKEKQKRQHHRSISGHGLHKNIHENKNGLGANKRSMRSSRNSAEDIEIVETDEKDIEVAPSYHYSNRVRNNQPLVISNPEKSEVSNDRQKEETLRLSSDESEPMEVTAVLRGRRRRRREIGPDELFRISPLYPRATGSWPAGSSSTVQGQWQKKLAPVPSSRQHRQEAKSQPKFESSLSSLANSPLFGGPSQRSAGIQNMPNYPRAASPKRQQVSEPATPKRASNVENVKRQQLLNVFPAQRSANILGRQVNKEPSKIFPSNRDSSVSGFGKNTLLNGGVVKKASGQAPTKSLRVERDDPKPTPPKSVNTTKQEPTPSVTKPKGSEIGVWKKLGEIFDINPKEADSDDETTVPPTSTSAPPAPPVIVISDRGGSPRVTELVASSRPEEHDAPKKSPPAAAAAVVEEARTVVEEVRSGGGERAKSGLRAAIVDRLLQDLRKMASARGSEMARAESDLIEILHDYQTDLMDEDEKTVSGMPFQGVRIHDNVAIPVVYPAVSIKLEGLSPHRLVVRSSDRSSDPRPARDAHNSWDDAPYNPP